MNGYIKIIAHEDGGVAAETSLKHVCLHDKMQILDLIYKSLELTEADLKMYIALNRLDIMSDMFHVEDREE